MAKCIPWPKLADTMEVSADVKATSKWLHPCFVCFVLVLKKEKEKIAKPVLKTSYTQHQQASLTGSGDNGRKRYPRGTDSQPPERSNDSVDSRQCWETRGKPGPVHSVSLEWH